MPLTHRRPCAGRLKPFRQGQWESGQALGLSKAAIFFRLVMPQMWRHALPGLGNQWLVLLKDTALVSLISVNDLMLQTKSIATRTQEPFNWYIIAAANLSGHHPVESVHSETY
ncbi:Arginine ABC transporter [Klebsiella michiganensis]|uniref:Arginine ABC transporter n=1 Tax=Klebsiella michiganensis TaxID=1134687 RepID=A0A7H4N2V9_9ENTR|nr:Arginine ABC transporter [Klebsiella michiganensis]